MAGLGTSELLIILAVVLLLFGSAKLPQLARSLGRSARILKTETKGLHDDDPAETQTTAPPARPLPATVRTEHRDTRTEHRVVRPERRDAGPARW
ncbi:twin-arginine translocase TatA/TatE family subunit [Actinomadura sp. LD22]|uniref:Sec-independent protein translocase protein TatA n=1 Tax=Actinomadura physcomitrii TaxID=2650748 RepID=A0A6I4M6H1_9ACTN|nr:Sec-independent protein translocase subunit TatA [Actinomadura physcomitrii]MVZ99756.1 twin-arginine translocase TatA/TatE family subunit [Actinomadura physcomitrii]